MQTANRALYNEDDRPGSALSNNSSHSQQQIKIPSRPPPMPPVIAPTDSDDVYDSQHSSSPTGEDNGNVTFKLIPPTPDTDKNITSFDQKVSKDEELCNVPGPPRRRAPLPPQNTEDRNFYPENATLGSTGSESLNRSNASNQVHVNAQVNVINCTDNDDDDQFQRDPSSPKMSSPLPPPPPEIDTFQSSDNASNGGRAALNSLPRTQRMSSSSSNQERHNPLYGVSGVRKINTDDEIQPNVEGFRSQSRFTDFPTLAHPRVQSRELLCDRTLTMQRPNHPSGMGQVRAATLLRSGHDGFSTLPIRPPPLISGMNPLGAMVPMNENDEFMNAHKSVFQRFGSCKYISIGYCVLISFVSLNLYLCQFYQPEAVKRSTVDIFSVSLYVLGFLCAVFLIFVCQLSKHDPNGLARDHRHCSVYLRAFLILLCLGTSLHQLSKIGISISFIDIICMEEHVPKLFHHASVLVFCYIEVYLIIVHSKVYISLQKFLVSMALAHCTFLNLYLILTTVISQLNVDLQTSSYNPTNTPDNNHLLGGQSIMPPPLKKMQSNYSVTIAPLVPVAMAPLVQRNEDEVSPYNSDTSQHVLNRHFVQCSDTSNFSNSANKTLLRFSQSMSRYCYPLAVSFAVLATAFLINLWCNVKRHAKRLNNRLTYNLSQRSKYFNCHHTSMGMILGLPVFLVGIVFVALFSVYKHEQQQQSQEGKETSAVMDNLLMVYHVYLIILMILMIGTIFKCIISFQLFTAKKSYHNIFDKPLLLTSLVAAFVYYLFCIVSCFGHFLTSGNDLFRTILPTLSYTLCLLEALLQVIFLMDALKRQATRKNDPTSRKYIGFILACNLTMWVLMVYRLGADIHHVEHLFYSDKWTYIRVIFAPFVIYFYLHSVACFFDIWQFSYN